MLYFRLSLAASLLFAGIANAQQPAAIRPEIRPFAGAYIPAGALRNDFKTATMLGVQAALELSDYFHVVGTVAWTHGHNKFAGVAEDLTYIWQYDLGVEFNGISGVRDELAAAPIYRDGCRRPHVRLPGERIWHEDVHRWLWRTGY